jgi:hypothetical protein
MRRLLSTSARAPAASPTPCFPLSHVLAAERQLALLASAPPARSAFPHEPDARQSVGTAAELSRALASLSAAGAHMECGLLLRRAAAAGVPLTGDARVAAVASAAWCGGAVVSAREAAWLAGVAGGGEAPPFTDASLLHLLGGYAAHLDGRAALAALAELWRVGSPLAGEGEAAALAGARRAGALRAAAFGRPPGAVDEALPRAPASALLLDALAAGCACARGRAFLWRALLQLLGEASDPEDGATAKRLWAAVAAARAPLPAVAAAALLRAAAASGDGDTCLRVLAARAAGAASRASPPLGAPLVVPVAMALGAAGRWRELLEALPALVGEAGGTGGAPGAWGGEAALADGWAAGGPPLGAPAEGWLAECLADCEEGGAPAPPAGADGGGGAAAAAAGAALVASAARAGVSLCPALGWLLTGGGEATAPLAALALRALHHTGAHEALAWAWGAGGAGAAAEAALVACGRGGARGAAPAPAAPLLFARCPPACALDGDLFDARAPLPGVLSALPHAAVSLGALGRSGEALATLRRVLLAPPAALPPTLTACCVAAARALPAHVLPGTLLPALPAAWPAGYGGVGGALALYVALALPARAPPLLLRGGDGSGGDARGAWLDVHAPVRPLSALEDGGGARLSLAHRRARDGAPFLAQLLADVRASGTTVPADAPAVTALHALQLEGLLAGGGGGDVEGAVRGWLAARPLGDAIAQFAGAVDALLCVEDFAGESGGEGGGGGAAAPHGAPPAATLIAYRVLFCAADACAGAVVASLGGGSSQPLVALEASLRALAVDVTRFAVRAGHARALTTAPSPLPGVPLHRFALRSLLAPLHRRGAAGACEGGGRRDAHALALAKEAAWLVGAVAEAAAAAARGGVCVWEPSDLGAFYMATSHFFLGGTAEGDRAFAEQLSHTTGTLLRVAGAGVSDGGGAHPLCVQRSHAFALASNLCATRASPRLLARVLGAICLGEAPAGGAVGAPATAASRIGVPEAVASLAVVAATRVRLCDEVRVWGRHPGRMKRALGAWDRHMARAGGFVVAPPADVGAPGAAPPWARYVEDPGALLLLHSRGRGGAGAAAPFSGACLDARGAPVRELPPLSHWAAHRDAPVRLPAPESGHPEDAAALHFPPGALAALMAAAAADPLQREELPSLARELMRLGAWLDGECVRVVAAAALRERALLAPLLGHLRAQAAAALAVLFPGPLGGTRLAALLPFVTVTGSGVTGEALTALLAAAAVHGDLPLALALLEVAPPRAHLPYATAARLVELAEEAAQPLLAARLSQALAAGAPHAWQPPAAALPPHATAAAMHRLARAGYPLLHA